MSLAKAVVTGTVIRPAEKRFTQNNIAVSAFIMQVDDREDTLVRVVSTRQNLEDTVSELEKGNKILVEGRLQTNVAKAEDGTEKRIFEINANSIEAIGQNSTVSTSVSSNDDIVKFESDDMSNELISEDEIPF